MFSQEPIAQTGSRFLSRVYTWMLAALAISGATALGVTASQDALLMIYGNTLVWMILLFGQLGLVIYLSARIRQMTYGTAITAFLLYSFMSGLTLSFIFLAYDPASIMVAFFVTAGMFGSMAVYGYVTKADLSAMGSYLMMGVFGLIIAMLVNMFMRSDQMTYFISLAGVFIFTLLTAYDVQKLKRLGSQVIGDSDAARKLSIIGALTLYLDFINLFLFILRLMGNRRN